MHSDAAKSGTKGGSALHLSLSSFSRNSFGQTEKEKDEEERERSSLRSPHARIVEVLVHHDRAHAL
jgi:hypothetical protein